jgi:hypothetical protein
MYLTQHPRLLARIGGVSYLAIVAFAMFAYLYVRGQLIHSIDMARTGADLLAHAALFRLGFSSAIVVAFCNIPMGWALYELLKVVNARLALLALLFIMLATTLEAVNVLNYIAPLFTFNIPNFQQAFRPAEIQALARGQIRTFDYLFSVDLVFFGAWCALTGLLILRSKFLPAILGLLMMCGGVVYEINSFRLFLVLQIPYLPWITLVIELSLAIWLVVFGVNEAKWRAQAETPAKWL